MSAGRGEAPPTPGLFVRSWGAGRAVTLLHGLGASSRYWDRLAALDPPFRATAPDLLGFGLSPTPPAASYDVECHLAALLPVLPPASIVVGHSTGGILAAALAARHPGRVQALVLVGLPVYRSEATARRQIGRLGLLARLTVAGHPLARLLCETMCSARPLAVALAPRLVRDLPAAIASDGARHTWASYSRTLQRVVVEHPVEQALHATRCPTWLLYGRDDNVVSLQEIDTFAEGGGSVEVRIVDGDHHVALRHTQVVADLIVEAFSAVPLRPSLEEDET